VHNVHAIPLLFTILFLSAGCGNSSEPGRAGEKARATDVAAGSGRETISAVEEYLRMAGIADTPDAGLNQEHMADGLRRLAGALGTLNLGAPALQVDLRVAAEHILLNPSSPATTESMRSRPVAAAEAIQTAADGDDSLRRLAESVRPGVPLLDQRATVWKFFQESANTIQRLSRQS
jgi:hypothetical protein